MKIRNNFQRHLILSILVLFNNLCLFIVFFILKNLYNVSFLHILLIFIFNGLFYNFFWGNYSKDIFKKYCNKDCLNCDMWHCDFYIKK